MLGNLREELEIERVALRRRIRQGDEFHVFSHIWRGRVNRRVDSNPCFFSSCPDSNCDHCLLSHDLGISNFISTTLPLLQFPDLLANLIYSSTIHHRCNVYERLTTFSRFMTI